MRSGRVTPLKKKYIFVNQYVLVTNVFSVSKLILMYLNTCLSSIDLTTPFKIGRYMLNMEMRSYAFLRSTDIIQVLNELPTDKKHC